MRNQHNPSVLQPTLVRSVLGLSILCLALPTLGFLPPASADDRYGIVPFEFPGAPITGGRGLNDAGCLVGYYQTDAADFSTAQALRICDGVLETLDIPGSIGDRRAFGINDSGTVVGSALRPTGQDGFELRDGVVTWVEYPGADLTVVRGINNLGDVVGEYENLDGVRRGFARIDGVFIDIQYPNAPETRARGINDLGEIVGSYTVGESSDSFRRSADGVYQTIAISENSTRAGGTNNRSDIVGIWFDFSGGTQGYLVIPLIGNPVFNVPGAVSTFITDINEAGQLTGEFIDDMGIHRGFVASPILFADGFETGDFDGWSAVLP